MRTGLKTRGAGPSAPASASAGDLREGCGESRRLVMTVLQPNAIVFWPTYDRFWYQSGSKAGVPRCASGLPIGLDHQRSSLRAVLTPSHTGAHAAETWADPGRSRGKVRFFPQPARLGRGDRAGGQRCPDSRELLVQDWAEAVRANIRLAAARKCGTFDLSSYSAN
jgi:hypothetical protein